MRRLLSWACYAAGDLWCRIAVGAALATEWPYRIYNRLMIWSVDLQGDGPGPWEARDDTAHLAMSPANAKRLAEAIDELDRGGGRVYRGSTAEGAENYTARMRAFCFSENHVTRVLKSLKKSRLETALSAS
jgi:hypothetical protein